MLVERVILNKITASLRRNKVIMILGARRVGKTILINQIIDNLEEPYLKLNGEDYSTHHLLENRSVQNYKHILGEKRILIIDEASKIPDIGSKLKLMIDEIGDIKILVTGSSAFDLQSQLGEPLTGRKIQFHLFPFSEQELLGSENITEKEDSLNQRLVYGNYPEVTLIKNLEDKSQYLKEITNSYLLKDILIFENIKNSSKVMNLLRLVAYQVGNEVSLQEIGKQLQISRNTVEKYLDLLSKVFIIHKLEGFSRNLRKEIVKNSKWYFYDNGIRNAVIANFNSITFRNDVGLLWENYILSERIKHQHSSNMIVNNYFWRTYDQQEIDLIEEREGSFFAYEFKWSGTKIKPPAAWIKAYSNSSFEVVTRNNFLPFVTEEK